MSKLHVEPEVHDVALIDNIVLALQPEDPLVLAPRDAVVGGKVVVRGRLSADEALLEVGVDHSGGLGGCHALLDGPRTRLLLACSFLIL